jgi:hypothetical protein
MDLVIIRTRSDWAAVSQKKLKADRDELIRQLREAKHGSIILEPESQEVLVEHIDGDTLDTIAIVRDEDGKLELVREPLT